jgi:hypothetical protein
MIRHALQDNDFFKDIETSTVHHGGELGPWLSNAEAAFHISRNGTILKRFYTGHDPHGVESLQIEICVPEMLPCHAIFIFNGSIQIHDHGMCAECSSSFENLKKVLIYVSNVFEFFRFYPLPLFPDAHKNQVVNKTKSLTLPPDKSYFYFYRDSSKK